MFDFQLRTDLDRVRLGAFALPLGIDPIDRRAPAEGYTLAYNAGEEDEPDTYTFHVVVSHERLRPLLRRVFAILPDRVSPIIEIDSYDAYRTVDVYIGPEDEIASIDDFLSTWDEFEAIFLEDGAVGAGANSDEPFIEVFLDQWKGVSIHVPLSMRENVERLLTGEGIEQVPVTWPESDGERMYDATIRPILIARNGEHPLDDFIFELKNRWNLELNVDPDRNLDETGRELGMTLWHAVLVVSPAERPADGPEAAMFVWASARSLSELETLINDELDRNPDWMFYQWYSITRHAFDDRPDSLDDMLPRRTTSEVHQVQFVTEDMLGDEVDS